MLTDRAVEIIAAPQNIEVVYHNQPVWIEAIDKERSMAEVVILGSKERRSVPVAELEETGFVEEL